MKEILYTLNRNTVSGSAYFAWVAIRALKKMVNR